LQPYLAAGGYVIQRLKGIAAGQTVTFNGTFAMPTTTTDKTISAYLQDATTFAQIPNSGQYITVSSIAKRTSFSVTKPANVTGDVELVLGGIPFGQVLYAGNFKEPTPPPAGSAVYSVSSDVQGWASINAKTTIPISSATGFVPSTQPTTGFTPVFLKDLSNKIVAIDLLFNGKTTLVFSPENSARAFVMTHMLFNSWKQAPRVEIFKRVDQDAEFSSLTALFRSGKRIAYSNASMDLSTRIALRVAKTYISEVKTSLGIQSQFKAKTIDENYPVTLLPPFGGSGNVVEPSPGRFKVENKSYFNWHVVKVRASEFTGVRDLFANQPVTDCPDPKTPTCYEDILLDGVFNTPGIPIIDQIVAAQWIPTSTSTFKPFDCSPHALALSAFDIRNLSDLTDPGILNRVALLSGLFGYLGTVDAATKESALAISLLNSPDMIAKFAVLLSGFDQLSKDRSNPEKYQQFLRYLIDFVAAAQINARTKQLGDTVIDVLENLSGQLTKTTPQANNGILAVFNITEFLGFAADAMLEFKAEQENKYYTARISHVKRDLINSPNPTKLETTAQPGSSGQISTSLTPDLSNGCPVAFTAKLIEAGSSGVAADITLSGALNKIISSGYRQINATVAPGGLSSLNVKYTCPTLSATFTGNLEITHNATNIPSPTNVPVKIVCIAAPKINADKTPIPFKLEGADSIGKSLSKTYTFSNVGTADLIISNLYFETNGLPQGITSPWYAISYTGGTVVRPQESKTLLLTVTCPMFYSNLFGAIRIETNDPVNPVVQVPVRFDCEGDYPGFLPYPNLPGEQNTSFNDPVCKIRYTGSVNTTNGPAGPIGYEVLYMGQTQGGIYFGYSVYRYASNYVVAGRSAYNKGAFSDAFNLSYSNVRGYQISRWAGQADGVNVQIKCN
jgi:hypothetical protein